MNLVAMNAKFNVLTSPAGNYMFKVNNRKTLEQGVKYVQS